MNDKSPLHAFFVGRAIAEGLYQQLESNLTKALSELGKFDAEQREHLREFTTAAIQRAEVEIQNFTGGPVNASYSPNSQTGTDLQANIDELRAEIAQLRVELQRYRMNRSAEK